MRIYEVITINLANQQKQAQVQRQQQALHLTQLQQQRQAAKHQMRSKSSVPSTPIPDPVKHERLIRRLTAHIARNANQPEPTQSDIETALNRFKQEQNRANYQYEKKTKLIR